MFGSGDSGQEVATFGRGAVRCSIAVPGIGLVEGNRAETTDRQAAHAKATDLHGVDWLCSCATLRHCDYSPRSSGCAIVAAAALDWVGDCWHDLLLLYFHAVCVVTLGCLSHPMNELQKVWAGFL